jgi:phosphohistidine phosphatase
MAIYLVQHGLSLAKEDDPEQGLSPTGITRVRLIADVAAHYGVRVEAIVHSGKKRAAQTAELFTTALEPAGGVSIRTGLMPMDDVTPLAGQLDPESNLMLVGHLPFMERLVSLLTIGSLDFRPFKFQNGGVVCLNRDGDNEKWYVKWALMPDIS